MTTTPDQDGSPTPTDREAIEADIEATRANLGETVDALSRKLDVKARVRAKATDTTQKVRTRAQEQPAIPIAAAAGVVLLVALVVWRRRS
jgi:hypothetical protein